MLENDPEVLEAFAEESAQRLNDLERGLLEMERTDAPAADLLNAMFRDAHSMKAGANLLGLRQVERAAHKLENVLDQLRAGRIASISTRPAVWAAPSICSSSAALQAAGFSHSTCLPAASSAQACCAWQALGVAR